MSRSIFIGEPYGTCQAPSQNSPMLFNLKPFVRLKSSIRVCESLQDIVYNVRPRYLIYLIPMINHYSVCIIINISDSASPLTSSFASFHVNKLDKENNDKMLKTTQTTSYELMLGNDLKFLMLVMIYMLEY